MNVPARDRFLELLRTALQEGSLVKLTLGKHRGADATLRNLFVRPVQLKSGTHLAFVWRHATRDITKNVAPAAALAQLEPLLGRDFLDAHLFTQTQSAQLETQPDGSARLRVQATAASPGHGAPAGAPTAGAHDAARHYLIPPNAPWLRGLGVMNDRGQPREGMADKHRQIQKFAELLSHLVAEAFPASDVSSASGADAPDATAALAAPSPATPLHVADMGSGKGYLTFAVAALLGNRARVQGIEARPELVALCNRIAQAEGMGEHLSFAAGHIADTPLPHCDILIALHACDTATDDALARGIQAGARLIVVSPCCQKELRRQLQAPPVLADALRHGIFQERQAEFVTDALRAQLLEYAGYRTKVFEFISTEHTAKNLMIAAVRTVTPGADPETAARLRAFAAFYGIRQQALASHLGVSLLPERPFVPPLPGETSDA
ncbi:SAM-dependent methyltransferase [Opitutus sp. ER46]|uniref:class I SAM-dependent methyltransferase n=1 Tax=Opitutus sp. ER46 TaxID=2161864 RepID=UPI000D31EBA9|nr:SAM-dependent methyltransferase [Opitutus sp. ER46]PTX91140.1 methyltransferase [Opitutus sp. ER46]